MGKYANAFLVKSDKVRDEVSNVLNGRRPVLSIKNGVDFKVFNKDTIYPDLKAGLGISKDSFIISNVAVLDERKGQKYLLEAAVRLREKYPIHFVISGEGPLRNTLEQEARQYKIDNIVHFLGRRSDVNCILANSQIFILPSNHEGLPNSLMEAMAMGVPCIATDVGGVRQLITDGVNGIIINPKSVDDIVESVTVLMNDKEKMKEMGDKAFQFIHDNFKQEEVAKELIQIYEDY
jgi:glycosyltransferase involved in cell wall biosynthesis